MLLKWSGRKIMPLPCREVSLNRNLSVIIPLLLLLLPIHLICDMYRDLVFSAPLIFVILCNPHDIFTLIVESTSVHPVSVWIPRLQELGLIHFMKILLFPFKCSGIGNLFQRTRPGGKSLFPRIFGIAWHIEQTLLWQNYVIWLN